MCLSTTDDASLVMAGSALLQPVRHSACLRQKSMKTHVSKSLPQDTIVITMSYELTHHATCKTVLTMFRKSMMSLVHSSRGGGGLERKSLVPPARTTICKQHTSNSHHVNFRQQSRCSLQVCCDETAHLSAGLSHAAALQQPPANRFCLPERLNLTYSFYTQET